MGFPAIPDGVHVNSVLIMLCLLGFEIVGLTQLTPYIDMMVSQIMGVEKGDQSVALWVCLIVGTYNISEALCARFWGAVADRIGYRSTFIISVTGDMFTTLLFGFSRSLEFAFAARFLDGCFCGNAPLAMAWCGSCIREGDDDTQFLAWPTTASALGFIVGPLFGSMLAEPAVWAPETFGGTLFEAYPYLLPNLAFAALKLALLVAVILYLQEPPYAISRTKAAIGFRIGIPLSTVMIRLIAMCSLFTGFITARMNCFVVLGSLPRSVGGLDMNEGNFGLLLITSAVAVVVYNVAVYPAVVKRFGPHRVIILASLGALVIMFATPLTGLTADPAEFGSWRLVPIGVWQVCFPPIATMVIVSGTVLINREASPSHRAETMGLFQSVNALTRGFVIYASGLVMDVGLRLESAYGLAGGRYVAFYVLSSFCFFNIHTVLKIGIPEEVDGAAKEGYQSLPAK